jgi:hypothetical protein
MSRKGRTRLEPRAPDHYQSSAYSELCQDLWETGKKYKIWCLSSEGRQERAIAVCLLSFLCETWVVAMSEQEYLTGGKM